MPEFPVVSLDDDIASSMRELTRMAGELMDHLDDPRQIALLMAILHHGIQNLAPGVVPPRIGTVVNSAQTFHHYLS